MSAERGSSSEHRAVTEARPPDSGITFEQLRSALTIFPDAAFVLVAIRDSSDAIVDLRFQMANDAFGRLYGLPPDRVVGRTHLELLPSLRGSQLWARYVEVVDTGRPITGESFWFDRNGEPGSLVITASKLNDGLLGMARDVTEAQLAARQLRQERDFSNALFDAARSPMMVVDRDLRIVRFNRESETLTGYREAELVGKEFTVFADPADREDVQRAVEEVVAGRGGGEHVHHTRTKDGRRRLVRWGATRLVDSQGNLTHVIAVAVDITEQQELQNELGEQARQLEAAYHRLAERTATAEAAYEHAKQREQALAVHAEELRVANEETLRSKEVLAQQASALQTANRELARSNADLEQFAYVASHDLREPVRSIAGPIHFLAEHYQGRPLDEQAEQLITYALNGCERMDSLIDGLLAYARVDEGQTPAEPTDATAAAQLAISYLESAIRESGAKVDVGPLPAVHIDAGALTQVFQNLIGNGLKFVAPGVTPHVVVAAEPAGARTWRFTVTDNGIGISPKQRERAFTLFSRLNPRDRYSGTGIGLAIVKKVVERHGGEVGIDDAPSGPGTRIWFTLPA